MDFTLEAAKDRPESYGPFIRVTNSYNGLRALSFDVGLYRKVCSNGLILPETIVRFKFSHQRRDLGQAIKFEIAADRLAAMKASLGESFAVMRQGAVPRALVSPLVRRVLGLRAPADDADQREVLAWQELSAYLHELSEKYVDELGENAYAGLNVISDMASRPPSIRCIRRERHSLQRMAGSWVSSFSKECKVTGFDLKAYLAGLNAQADMVGAGR